MTHARPPYTDARKGADIIDFAPHRQKAILKACSGDSYIAEFLIGALVQYRATTFPNSVIAIGPELMVEWRGNPTDRELRIAEAAAYALRFSGGTHVVGDGGFLFGMVA